MSLNNCVFLGKRNRGILHACVVERGAECTGDDGGIDWHPLSPGLIRSEDAEYHPPAPTRGLLTETQDFTRRGVGHDLWYAIIPDENGNASAQRPMNATTWCSLW
eukprot:8480295-Pyramimonas_sp.AAC.2